MAAPMPFDICLFAMSEASSMGEVVMSSERFTLASLHRREKRHEIAFFQFIIAFLVLQADGDEHGVLHRLELWKAREQLFQQVCDGRPRLQAFGRLRSAGEVAKVGVKID